MLQGRSIAFGSVCGEEGRLILTNKKKTKIGKILIRGWWGSIPITQFHHFHFSFFFLYVNFRKIFAARKSGRGWGAAPSPDT